MNNSKIGIITFSKFNGRELTGSSKIRGQWLQNHWKEAELFKMGKKYDVVIYQKAYWVEHAKIFDGIKILDLCDPDWLHWGYRTIEMIEEVDAITTSTEALAIQIRKFTNKPVQCIPDRIDLDEIKEIKVHEGKAKKVAWFGYSTGFPMLRPAVHHIKKMLLGLIVISDKGFMPPTGNDGLDLTNYPHKWETIYKDLLEADIIINPQSKNGKWQYKSNNKTLLAWALGIPVAEDIDELKRFMEVEERIKESEKRKKEIDEKWDIKYSVNEFKELIDVLHSNK